MTAINDLFTELKKMRDEIRRLTGRLNSISVGSQIITPNIPGTAAVPAPILGAIIVGNATPAWEREPPPAPSSGQKYELTFNFGDTKPVWRLRTAIGQYRQFVYTVDPGIPDFTFIITSDGNPVFVLQDLE